MTRRVQLRQATTPTWLPLALERFDAVLVDHAHCEKKAAANALSMLQAYPEVPGLPAQMARLAREESAHLARVLDHMARRGLSLTVDRGDPYAKGLQRHVRNPREQRRLDRLLIAALIEERSRERLELLASGLPPGPLHDLYDRLARSEAGHATLFVRLAERVESAQVVEARLDVLLEHEAELIRTLPVRPAIH